MVRRAIAAYNEGDLDATEAMSHPDIELDWSASRGLNAGTYEGVEAVGRFYEDMFTTFDEIKLEPDRFVEVGDSVIVPNTSHNRGRDGVLTTARSTLVFTVRGGLIARIRLYQELREALEALGQSE